MSIQKGEFFDTLTDITNKVQEVNDNVNSLAKSLIWQNPVANFAALATTYPTPEIGWAAMVTSLGFVYSWNGTAWKSTGLSSFPGDVETFIGVVSEKIATNELASNLIQRYYIDSVGHSHVFNGYQFPSGDIFQQPPALGIRQCRRCSCAWRHRSGRASQAGRYGCHPEAVFGCHGDFNAGQPFCLLYPDAAACITLFKG